jgi:C4-dicarboxylate-specific signal transduction histidine kinase
MGIAHDFNNLLTPVLSNAEALMAALPATMPRERESAEEISVAALMARDIVAKILAFARNSADSGRVVLDARDACRDTVRLVRTTAPRGISVLFDADDAQLFVRGQARDLEQVVLNLCMNALKAMSNEGLLRVQVRAAKGSEGVEGVEISVEDSGCGIPRDRIARNYPPTAAALTAMVMLLVSVGGFLALDRALRPDWFGLVGFAAAVRTDPDRLLGRDLPAIWSPSPPDAPLRTLARSTP